MGRKKKYEGCDCPPGDLRKLLGSGRQEMKENEGDDFHPSQLEIFKYR